MAESILSQIAADVVGKFGSFALKEVALAWGLETELEKIKEMLIAIKAVILDAEQQQGQSEGAKFWVEKLTRVLYDAEDVLDEFDYEALRKQVLKSMSIPRKVRRFFSTSNPVVFRLKMGHKLKNIRERVAEIADLRSKLGLTERIGERHVIGGDREMTHSFVDAADVIGRNREKEIIIEKLEQCVDGENVSVIPIVGMGGLGKTTLAKLVYNDGRVDGYFDKKLWVCISDDFDLQKVIIKILKSAGQKYQDMDLDQLQIALRETLNGRKYLIVMDDAWNDDPKKWEDLRSLVKGGAKGSKILVTTRSHKVAEIMGTVGQYNLGDLSLKNCLDLFFKCAFKERQEQLYPNLRKIGEEIVMKCKGVPLAVITLGSLLYSTKNQHDWEYVRDNEIWRLDQKENGIMPALRMSYEQLPSYLKRCFAYCSLFPKDYIFFNLGLVQFWMAQGLLQTSNPDQELEDVGILYFNELCSRGFFQDFDNEGYEMYGEVYCKMHDLVHDLASLMAQNECSVITSKDQYFPQNACHLLFDEPHMLGQDYFTLLDNMKKVRTIIFGDYTESFNYQSIIDTCFSKLKGVRTIDLGQCQFGNLPRRIGHLKHLRSLELSFNCQIRELPNSICQLQHLQALFLQDCEGLEELPRDIKYLISLRYLCITISGKCLPKDGIGRLKSLRTLFIDRCKSLEYLMEDMEGLISLRNLYLRDCEKLISLPQSVKYLTSLKRLAIENCENLDLTMEEEEVSSGLKLRNLFLRRLPRVEELPQWLLPKSTATLQLLALEDCNNLKELPMCSRDQTTIQKFWVKNCEVIRERCKPETGEDWHKIARIPEIRVDGHYLKNQPLIY